MNEEKEKNSLFIPDINTNDKTLTYKIFHYFHYQLKGNKEFKTWLSCILILIESVQFISYAFSPIHFDSWKLEEKSISKISTVISAFRLSSFIKLMKNEIYYLILYLVIVFIFVLCLSVVLQILFSDTSSRLFKYSAATIWSLINILSIFLFIPLMEIVLTPIQCVNGKVYGLKNDEICWNAIHYLRSILGVLGGIFFFLWCSFMISFSFYPFQKSMSTIRINSTNDLIIIIMKLVAILQNIFIKNEYASLAILFIIAYIMFYFCYNENSYNNSHLELIIIIKNLLILWTYFVLFLTKIFQSFIINGFIYLLVIGYPVMVYLSILLNKEKEMSFTYLSGNICELKSLLKKIKFNIKLINAFIERSKNVRNENDGQRNIILLNGNIKMHNTMCVNKDCPLKKFMNNEGNLNLQKQCLFNYMNAFFNKGLKIYPKSTSLLILFIHFNYSKRFNLNSVKTNLYQLKKLKCSFKENFIIYVMEQNIKNMKNDNGTDINNENDDSDSQIDITLQKYQKLKYLIENSIKLFSEFWGIFSTNVTNNLNTTKLYSLGEKLNKHLNEINNLWDNELKNKKINLEYQNILQLYSKFLLEILWNKKKSQEVIQKLNDENMNFQQNDKQKKDENNNRLSRMEKLIDNQEFILFGDADEKGNCKIIQLSASLSHFLNYEKYNMIGKAIDIILPNILVEEHCKYLEECIKSLHNEQNSQKDLSYRGNDSNDNLQLVMVKNKMGYIFPLYASFKILDDNDYSNSFLLKAIFECKESKSEYAYYVLTKNDFSVENISSSAINLGLSLDLLKKYVVKIDILIRSLNNEALNLYDSYDDYDEEPRQITWVFPDVIYPKDNSMKNKDEDIEDLIKASKTKEFNLQIKAIKYNPYEISAFSFKFTKITQRRTKIINNDYFIPKSHKNIIMYDIYELKYIRTIIVNKKSGKRNLRNEEHGKEISKGNNEMGEFKNDNKKHKKDKDKISEVEEEESNNSKDNIRLTKEKILELQGCNSSEIKKFISSLPLYDATEVGLERFMPNGEKYSASKITESLINIQVSNFCKRIDEKVGSEQLLKKKHNIIHKEENINNLESPKSSSINNLLIQHNSSTSSTSSVAPTTASSQGEEVNKGIISDSSSTLVNLFKVESINYIKILVGLSFLCIILLVTIEFFVVYRHISNIKVKIDFLQNGCIILNDLLYTKFFLTEGVLYNTMQAGYYPYRTIFYSFFLNASTELLFYKQDIAEKYDIFTSNKICKEYVDFMAYTNITIYTLTMNTPEQISLLFNTVLGRIPASLSYITTSQQLFRTDSREGYELMYNLLNQFYSNWKKVNDILLNDTIKSTQLKSPLKFIIICYVLLSIIILAVFLKLLSIFSIDRERPLNLFLTIKKRVFENLKNSADTFSNKLLNKFFGNEDNEEESQQEYQANVQPNDINIVKFKSVNEYHTSVSKENSFVRIFIGMIVFLILYLVYFIVKYINFRGRMEKIYEFINIYDKTNIANNEFMLTLNVLKSYLFDRTIPILNRQDTLNVLIEKFLNMSNKFEESIIYISKTKSFLNKNFLDKFEKYLYNDLNELLTNQEMHFADFELPQKSRRGLKNVIARAFEIMRTFMIRYFYSSDIQNLDSPYMTRSNFLSEDNYLTVEIIRLVHYLIRPWYNGIIDLMINSYYEYQSKCLLNYTIFFICLIALAILVYTILWKSYEEKLNLLIKGSIDLINLIPQEIKNIIAEKLNE